MKSYDDELPNKDPQDSKEHKLLRIVLVLKIINLILNVVIISQ